jgi:hypothetical protein
VLGHCHYSLYAGHKERPLDSQEVFKRVKKAQDKTKIQLNLDSHTPSTHRLSKRKTPFPVTAEYLLSAV